MNTVSKYNLDGYVRNKLLAAGTLSEIRGLLLFFKLIQHRDYPKLAGLVDHLYKINGLENIAPGAMSLHHHLSRNFKLFSSVCFWRKINFNDPDSLDYLFKKIEEEMHYTLRQLHEIFYSNLVKKYPELLSILLEKVRECQTQHNSATLKNGKTIKIIEKYFREKRVTNTPNLEELASEFEKYQDKLMLLFSPNMSTKNIIHERKFFSLLTTNDLVSLECGRARLSNFASKGAIRHLAVDTPATIINSSIFVIFNFLITAFLQWVAPLIPVIGSPGVLPFLGAILVIIPIMITIYLQPYVSHHYIKKTNRQIRELLLNLANDIPEYQARLAETGFDLSELINKRGLFANNQAAPATIHQLYVKVVPTEDPGTDPADEAANETTNLVVPTIA